MVELLENKDYNIKKQVKNKFENYFKIYCLVGGMPEIVNNYLNNRDFNEVALVQNYILKSYDLDFSKHSKNDELKKIRMGWNFIPQSLAKENKKFKYSDIKKDGEQKSLKLLYSF